MSINCITCNCILTSQIAVVEIPRSVLCIQAVNKWRLRRWNQLIPGKCMYTILYMSVNEIILQTYTRFQCCVHSDSTCYVTWPAGHQKSKRDGLKAGVRSGLLMFYHVLIIASFQKSCNSRICLMMDIHKIFYFFLPCRQICLTSLLTFSSTEMVSKI